MARATWLKAAAVLVFGLAAAESPKTVNVVRLDVSAVAQDLGMMAMVTDKLHAEQSRCVVSWARRDSANVTTLVLKRLGPAEVAYSDSLRVGYYLTTDSSGVLKLQVCGDSMPSIHSHVLDNGWLDTPSSTDSATVASRPRVPFGLLMSVSTKDSLYRLHVFGLKPK